MKILNQNINKTFCFALLIIVCFSVYLTSPIQANAQSIFSDKPKSDANDDKRLCVGDKAPLRNDKYCQYYLSYRDSEGTNPTLAAEYRNKMLYVVKEQIDAYYDAHKNGRKVKNKWFQTTLDILGIGAAFAANITNGERAKTVIAASLGGFQAGRNTVNERFQLLQIQILINKMNANRLEQWTEILKNSKKDTKDYPWDAARVDLQQYLFRGTFNDALDSLVNETGAEVAAAEKNLQIVGAVPKGEFEVKLKAFETYMLPMQKKLDLLFVDIEKFKKEIDILPDGDAKTTKQKELESLNTQKTNLLTNYQTIWLAIIANGDFATIEEKILSKPGLSEEAKEKFRNFTKKIKNKELLEVTEKVNEYDRNLNKVNDAIGLDESLRTNFLKILDAHKL